MTGLLGPLLADLGVHLVKGWVRTEEDGSVSTEGGRVTELVARPLVNLWWPQLAGVVQPLAGEWAARRALMESLPIPVGYGWSRRHCWIPPPGTAWTRWRKWTWARAHRHQANHDLGVMAELLALAENRRSGPHRLLGDVTLEQCSGRRPCPPAVPAGRAAAYEDRLQGRARRATDDARAPAR